MTEKRHLNKRQQREPAQGQRGNKTGNQCFHGAKLVCCALWLRIGLHHVGKNQPLYVAR